jgi:hypothetical protein
MNKIIQLSLILAVFCVFNAKVLPQSTTTMQDIFETVSGKVTDLEEKSNKEVVNVTFDLLVNQNSKSIYRFLDGAFTYDMALVGDRRVGSFKVSVYKQGASDWELVETASGLNPKIKLYPKDFEEFQFVVAVTDFKGSNNAGHFALILYHDNPEKSR